MNGARNPWLWLMAASGGLGLLAVAVVVFARVLCVGP